MKNKKRCRHCNSRLQKEVEELLDPKKELCDKCYFKTNELESGIVILELNIICESSSMEELIDYFDSFCNYTNNIASYNMRFKLEKK